MKRLLACILAVAPVVVPASAIAQSREVSADIGLGVSVRPSFPGADDFKAGPWVVWQNFRYGRAGERAGEAHGFSISPSFGLVGSRNQDDDDAFTGMDDIDRAYELGARVTYTSGPLAGYASLRKGWGGHDGWVGAAGVKYRTDVNDRVSLWTGLEVDYADSDYNDTYFGVSTSDAANSRYDTYDVGGGINKVAAKLNMRYRINDLTSVLGEVEYGRLVGDAGDSPLVQDRDQPAVRLGIVRRFSFGF